MMLNDQAAHPDWRSDASSTSRLRFSESSTVSIKFGTERFSFSAADLTKLRLKPQGESVALRHGQSSLRSM